MKDVAPESKNFGKQNLLNYFSKAQFDFWGAKKKKTFFPFTDVLSLICF